MFKKFFLLLITFILFCGSITFAEETHFLYKDWYNIAETQLPREKVTAISLICDESEPHNYDFTWDMDGKGLKGFIVNDTEVIIHFPDGDKLKAGTFSDGLFSFYQFEKNDDYETGDNGEIIRGVRAQDHMDDDDYYAEFKSSLIYIENLDLLDTSSVTTMEGMFYGDRKLENIDVSYFNTRLVTDMRKMFYECESLTSLDLSVFDTSSVTNMAEMFASCTNLSKLDVSCFNTSNVTDMWRMFYNCKSLTTVNLSSFDTTNVEDMGNMFKACSNLQILNLKNFKADRLNSSYEMFEGCENLSTLDLSSFNTKILNDATFMFRKCKNLVGVDLSAMDMTYADIFQIFSLCDKLKYININDTFAKKLGTSRLDGIWRHIISGQIYNSKDSNIEKTIFPAGVYEKIAN